MCPIARRVSACQVVEDELRARRESVLALRALRDRSGTRSAWSSSQALCRNGGSRGVCPPRCGSRATGGGDSVEVPSGHTTFALTAYIRITNPPLLAAPMTSIPSEDLRKLDGVTGPAYRPSLARLFFSGSSADRLEVPGHGETKGVVRIELERITKSTSHRGRLAFLTDDERAAVRQRLQHGVDPAEVIEEEKHLRPIAGASLPLRIDQCVEIKQWGLVLSRRPRGEHDEPGGAPVAQTPQDRWRRGRRQGTCKTNRRGW